VRRVTLTRVDGSALHLAAEHVVGARPVLDGGAEVRTIDGSGWDVTESADEVAALVWPASWQVEHRQPARASDTPAPDGFAPIGPWEFASAYYCGADSEWEPGRIEVWRRPLRRVGGAS
jgi:hypothetical protein